MKMKNLVRAAANILFDAALKKALKPKPIKIESKTVNVVAGINAIECPVKGCKATVFIAVPLHQLAVLQARANTKKIGVRCQAGHHTDVRIRSNVLRYCIKK
jgi:hypothetical protein